MVVYVFGTITALCALVAQNRLYGGISFGKCPCFLLLPSLAAALCYYNTIWGLQQGFRAEKNIKHAPGCWAG